MGPDQKQNIIVVGCGRVGAELALSIYQQNHNVAVVDSNPRAFDKLGPEFRGRTVQGEAIDRDVLRRAGIENADALAAVPWAVRKGPRPSEVEVKVPPGAGPEGTAERSSWRSSRTGRRVRVPSTTHRSVSGRGRAQWSRRCSTR